MPIGGIVSCDIHQVEWKCHAAGMGRSSAGNSSARRNVFLFRAFTRMLLCPAIAVMPLAVVSLCLLWSPGGGLTTAVWSCLCLPSCRLSRRPRRPHVCHALRSMRTQPSRRARLPRNSCGKIIRCFAGLSTASTDPVYVKDARGRYLIVNRATG